MNAVATIPQHNLAPSSGVRMNALVPNNIAEALSLADIMAKASLIPDHLRNKPGDCLLIVMQAQRWGMDAVSVAQCTSVVRGKLCYEGKLVAAALYAMGAIDGRLRYEFSGSGDARKVVVSGKPRGTGVDQTVEGTVADWKTDNGNWKKSPDDMLVYRGTRQWARRYAPEALLGVYTPDEMEEAPPTQDGTIVATVAPGSARTEKPVYPADEFAKNLPKWWDLIVSGKNTADDLIAKLSSRATFTADQLQQIRNPPKDEVADDDQQQDAQGQGEGA